MSLLLLLRTPSATTHALTGVASGQGVGAARLAVLRRMAGAASGQGRRHREAGTGPPRGWLGCRRRDRLWRAPGSSRPARDRRRLRHIGRAPGGPPETPRRGRRIGRRRRTVGPRAPVAGEATGTSTVLGRASCVSMLAGVATGWSRVFGLMLSRPGTPASRTVRVRPEARTYRPAIEDRCMSVRPEARTIRPAAEDRTIHPQRENRSIDA